MKGLVPARLRSTNVIAEREYQLVTKGGKKKRVFARFGKPRRLPDGPGAYCLYQIDGLEEAPKARFSPGVDGVQALFLAMQAAWTELVTSDAYREGRLSFWGIPDLGLPLLEFKLPDGTSGRQGTRPGPPRSRRRPRPRGG
jgi:hypothetical protein